MNKYWSISSTEYIPSWETLTSFGKISVNYTIKK